MRNTQTQKRLGAKPRIRAMGLTLLSSLALLLLSVGCQNPVQSQSQWQGTGTFSLTIDGGAEQRTILPSPGGFARFELEFTPRADGQKVTQTWSGAAGTVELAAGIWDLQVDAYMEATEGSGTFSWDISFPEDMQRFYMEIRGISTSSYSWTGYFVGQGGSNEIINNPGSRQLQSGYYRVSFTGYHNNSYHYPLTYVLHIYDNMESRFEFDFTQDLFTVTLERHILDAWDGTQGNFAADGITAEHFEIAGVNGVTEGNFDDMVRWFTTLQTAAGGAPSNLGRLVDAALIGLASEDAAFLNAANYQHKTHAEDAIGGLFLNSSRGGLNFNDWVDDKAVQAYLSGYRVQFTFSGAIEDMKQGELARLLKELRDNNPGGTVEITLDEDEEINASMAQLPSGTAITIEINGSVPVTVSLLGGGTLFSINNNVTLVLGKNITLKGQRDNTSRLITVNNGGTLEMNAGSAITGNGNGGVTINNNGTFTMHGGEISGNTSNGQGGGVYNYGTFTMNGGEIHDNTSSNEGGGVFNDRGTFTMNNDGKIHSNTGRYGGGVSTTGTFTMNGGEISGNTASTYGGGVENWNGGTFRISNGIIYGTDAEDGYKNTSPSPAALSGSAAHGTFNGDSFTQVGTIQPTDLTIEVVNGALISPLP